MNIEKIKASMKEVKNTEDDVKFYGEEIYNLIMNIAQYIIKNDPKNNIEEVPDSLIPFSEFIEKYTVLISKTTLQRLCNDEKFCAAVACVKAHNVWFLDEVSTLNYLNQIPTYQRRINLIRKSLGLKVDN